MTRFTPILLGFGMASLAGAALAQQAAPQRLQSAPHVFAAPPTSYGNRVSPFGRGGEFPSHRFLSELAVAETTHNASYGHTREVDLANKASVLIDHGDCDGAETLLRTMGAPAMADRVAPTCEAKRRGLI